ICVFSQLAGSRVVYAKPPQLGEKTAMLPRFAFVVPYYGNWPRYWRLWAESAANNPRFDFLILTDLPRPESVPDNVHIVPMRYAEVSHRLSGVLGFSLPNFATYHKMCDFKPFYGLAFADLLGSYQYWGYCDVDLFFGDLQPLVDAAESDR